MIVYKISNKKGFKYIFTINDKFSKFHRCVPLKNKNGQTITTEISNILTKSKPSSFKLESERGLKWYISVFQTFLKAKNIQHYSRYTD